ncbi:LIM and cysteine-rich domains protein 1 isoform X2 [Genypterus blacodes]|uniref:LIM and cysteine-rich domains protein 1 isoform X2 n=1 Tax=Genypterus blacodes TaxID=154954 RepID=UPI003F75A3D9
MTSTMEKATAKQSVGGAGRGAAPCLLCNESCSGFQSHSWRKACTACGCSMVDHALGSHDDDDQHVGSLLADSVCSHLTAKVKGGGGRRLYKRNRMIVTNPVVSGKDPTFSTTTYDWVPTGHQKLAMQYMELLPECWRPVSGTDGALERRKQLLSQLPAYDQDPMQCQSLASQDEEVLGVGEVALPGEGEALRETAIQRRAKECSEGKAAPEHQDHEPTHSNTTPISSSGMENSVKSDYRCTGCLKDINKESPAVYAERAGYSSAMWHPTCFVCSQCGQGLVDLVYFWSNQKLFCGRHYCQTVWPRCSGCDELIFCQSFHTVTDGRTWHHHHYCCWRCGESLDVPCQH